MILPKPTTLLFAPTGKDREAEFVELTADLVENGIHHAWWKDPSLRRRFDPMPIDRYWNWNDIEIEFDGRPLSALKIAVVTDNQAVQGAMLVSNEQVPSVLDPNTGTLFIERLFTAPRNRPDLRRDGSSFFVGAGSKLLAWAAAFSQERGYDGRLLLDASPDFVGWYEKRGLQKLRTNPIVFEDVQYIPMELPPDSARRLSREWK